MSDTPASETPSPAEAAKGGGRSKLRTVLSVTLGILAIVALIASTVALWARNTVLDSEKVADGVVAALQQPEVVDAAAAELTVARARQVTIEGWERPVKKV